jgi:hypothetical protein
MGTARVAEINDHGVVDRRMKMFHSTNGYFRRCAVFPTSSFLNLTHTLVALAVRLGGHFKCVGA